VVIPQDVEVEELTAHPVTLKSNGTKTFKASPTNELAVLHYEEIK
jgi:hypothetical protein